MWGLKTPENQGQRRFPVAACMLPPPPTPTFPSISQIIPPSAAQHLPPRHCVKSPFPDRSALVLHATVSTNMCVCVVEMGCPGPNVSGQGGALQDGKGLGHSQNKETHSSVFTKARKLTSVQGMPCCLPGILRATRLPGLLCFSRRTICQGPKHFDGGSGYGIRTVL